MYFISLTTLIYDLFESILLDDQSKSRHQGPLFLIRP